MALVGEVSGTTRRTATNGSGFFAFAAVPAGTYTVRVTTPGFNTREVTGIELQGGDSRTVLQRHRLPERPRRPDGRRIVQVSARFEF